MFNALQMPFIRLLVEDVASPATLPEAFARLSIGRPVVFPALRPHQAPAWHAFLVQLAVMACLADDRSVPPGDDPEAWASLLRALTADHDDDAPWHLVSPPDRPALLQPPVPEGDLSSFKTLVEEPDALDLLVTSKNHDIKASRMRAAAPDDWFFALLSLQTQEGFLGAGNYGIARMNGGFGSRPYMRLGPPGGGFGVQVMRDIRALLGSPAVLEEVANRFGYQSDGAVGLTWLETWDGVTSTPLTRLHPLFIETCRRVRLVEIGGRLMARTAPSTASHVDAKAQNGVLGDPWAPFERAPMKLLTITSDGFSYRKVTELLFGSDKRSYVRPFLARPTPDEAGTALLLQLQALARGQGKTEGFHNREILIPPAASQKLDDETLGGVARTRIRDAGIVAGKVLRPALIVLVQKGPEEASWSKPSNDSLVGPSLARFDREVDDIFFPMRWAALHDDGTIDAEAALNWVQKLGDLARDILRHASATAPQSAERRIMAHARARNLLEGSLYRNFPQLQTRRGTPDAA